MLSAHAERKRGREGERGREEERKRGREEERERLNITYILQRPYQGAFLF